MRVPHTALNPDTLNSVIEAFVLREGTDYGAVERTLESKVAQVLRQLEAGTAFITYDEESDSVSIVAKDAPVETPPPAPVRTIETLRVHDYDDAPVPDVDYAPFED